MKLTGLSRVSKEAVIAELEKEVQKRPLFFVTQCGSVSAAALDKLRSRLRQAGARYLVFKRSLGERALERAKLSGFLGDVGGPFGIAFSSGDPVAPSKILVEFARQNEAFKIQNAFWQGRTMDGSQIRQLASLPSREVLIARVVGGMQSPLSRLLWALSGTLGKLVRVLDQIQKHKGAK